jgi:threonine dehydratase
MSVLLHTTASTDSADAERAAREYALGKGAHYVSPYNDVMVVGGQGTAAVEMLGQLAAVGALETDPHEHHMSMGPQLMVLVPVGGGGLISGIAAWVKAVLGPRGVWVVGCQPRSNPCMFESIGKGRVLGSGEFRNDDTLSDGTAGGVEDDALTFAACRELVDQWVLVDEPDIQDAMAWALAKHKLVVEGAAGTAIAATRAVAAGWEWDDVRGVWRDPNFPATLWRPGAFAVAVLVCGSNVAVPVLESVARRAKELYP